MGHQPLFIGAVAAKSPIYEVAKTPFGHILQTHFRHFESLLVAREAIDIEQRVDGGGVGEFGLGTKPSVDRVEELLGALDEKLGDIGIETYSFCGILGFEVALDFTAVLFELFGIFLPDFDHIFYKL